MYEEYQNRYARNKMRTIYVTTQCRLIYLSCHSGQQGQLSTHPLEKKKIKSGQVLLNTIIMTIDLYNTIIMKTTLERKTQILTNGINTVHMVNIVSLPQQKGQLAISAGFLENPKTQ